MSAHVPAGDPGPLRSFDPVCERHARGAAAAAAMALSDEWGA